MWSFFLIVLGTYHNTLPNKNSRKLHDIRYSIDLYPIKNNGPKPPRFSLSRFENSTKDRSLEFLALDLKSLQVR